MTRENRVRALAGAAILAVSVGGALWAPPTFLMRAPWLVGIALGLYLFATAVDRALTPMTPPSPEKEDDEGGSS